MRVKILLIFTFVLLSASAQPKKQSSALDKVLHTMFPSTKPKVVVKPRKNPHIVEKHIPRGPSKLVGLHVEVTPEWMARYWEQEALWDYTIPDDNLIRFNNGKYVVPVVVYRHYEDMVNSTKRADR